jgi:hypothetical protein
MPTMSATAKPLTGPVPLREDQTRDEDGDVAVDDRRECFFVTRFDRRAYAASGA